MSLNDFIANESKAKIVGVKIMPLREGIAEEHNFNAHYFGF